MAGITNTVVTSTLQLEGGVTHIITSDGVINPPNLNEAVQFVNIPVLNFNTADMLTVSGTVVSNIASGIRTNGEDTVHVAQGGVVQSTFNSADAIVMAGSGNTVLIDGTVFGGDFGIIVRVNTINQTLNIGSTGVLRGGADIGANLTDSDDGYSAAILMLGGAEITNHGLITALANNGTGDRYAISTADEDITSANNFSATFGGTLNLVNTGTIDGDIWTVSNDDDIRNTGTILGDITLNDGDDTIDSREGEVIGTVDLGEGNNLAFGGTGNDTIIGGNETDNIWGGDGNDSIVGGAGQLDNLRGGGGDDAITSSGIFSSVHGGSGNDLIVSAGASSDLSLNGDSGNDTIETAANVTTVIGGSGNDVITLSGSLQRAFGGTGNDLIVNEGTDATVFGGDGEDTFLAHLLLRSHWWPTAVMATTISLHPLATIQFGAAPVMTLSTLASTAIRYLAGQATIPSTAARVLTL